MYQKTEWKHLSQEERESKSVWAAPEGKPAGNTLNAAGGVTGRSGAVFIMMRSVI